MLADQAGVHSPFAGAAATSNKAPAATIGFQGRRILHSHAAGYFPRLGARIRGMRRPATSSGLLVTSSINHDAIYDKLPRQALRSLRGVPPPRNDRTSVVGGK